MICQSVQHAFSFSAALSPVQCWSSSPDDDGLVALLFFLSVNNCTTVHLTRVDGVVKVCLSCVFFRMYFHFHLMFVFLLILHTLKWITGGMLGSAETSRIQADVSENWAAVSGGDAEFIKTRRS